MTIKITGDCRTKRICGRSAEQASKHKEKYAAKIFNYEHVFAQFIEHKNDRLHVKCFQTKDRLRSPIDIELKHFVRFMQSRKTYRTGFQVFDKVYGLEEERLTRPTCWQPTTYRTEPFLLKQFWSKKSSTDLTSLRTSTDSVGVSWSQAFSWRLELVPSYSSDRHRVLSSGRRFLHNAKDNFDWLELSRFDLFTAIRRNSVINNFRLCIQLPLAVHNKFD